MPNYMFIHPWFGAAAAILILSTFLVKFSKLKLKQPHYILGTLAFFAVLLAGASAVWAMFTYFTKVGNPLEAMPLAVFIPHAVLAAILILTVLTQVCGGVMLRFKAGGREKIYPLHKKNGYFIFILTLLVITFGGLTLQRL